MERCLEGRRLRPTRVSPVTTPEFHGSALQVSLRHCNPGLDWNLLGRFEAQASPLTTVMALNGMQLLKGLFLCRK